MRTTDLQRKRQLLRSVCGDRSGSVAIVFAIAMVPVIIAAGIGIDVTRAMSSRSNLQDALDAAALALAHLPPTTSDADFKAKADTWMQANLHDNALGPVTLSMARSKGQVVLTAASTVPTTLTAIAGYKQLDVAATTTVKWGLGHVEVALVLDNTGSMAGTKLTMLKNAASGLVDTLVASNTSGDPAALKISLVPFSMTVRVDSTYRTSAWMTGKAPSQYFPPDVKDLFNTDTGVDRFKMLDQMGVTWKGCLESRPQPYDVQETAPSTGVPATMFVPYFAPDEPDSKGVVKKKVNGNLQYYSFSNNYLDDGIANDTAAGDDWNDLQKHQGNKSKYNQAPSGGVNSTTTGPNMGCSMLAVQRLTTSTSTIKTKITQMQATGNTNVPMGLVWGWHTVSPYGPFGDGVPYSNADTQKFIVLLTDGDNTNNTTDDPNDSNYSGLGYIWQKRLGAATGVGSSANERMLAMDARLKKLCENIDATEKIKVFVVRIDVSGTAPTALSGCATESNMFYDIDSAGLNEAFQNIAGEIARLRIAS
jgi:Flp pilus assembly protein TadG